jgi:hypothetical protein
LTEKIQAASLNVLRRIGAVSAAAAFCSQGSSNTHLLPEQDQLIENRGFEI